MAVLLMGPALQAQIRVQDIARLQGQRTNRMFGFGLVVGLNGTGDGSKSASTLRALQKLHRVYHQPVFDVDELKANNNVAIVSVEVLIPEFGAREGERLDVVVSALGPSTSLAGGQLLTTPLQEATLSLQDILALAGGRIDLSDKEQPTRGLIRGGATLERDFFYSFIDGDRIWLVLDDSHAGFQWAQVVARSINHALGNPAGMEPTDPGAGRVVARSEFAIAVGPKNVSVKIAPYELPRPAAFIDRVLQTPLFMPPKQAARVVINRKTNQITMTGTVTISPTVLQIPGLGAISVGTGNAPAPSGVLGLNTDSNGGGVEFKALLNTLGKLQLPPEKLVQAVEHLYRTGTLNAQLVYTE